jgi:Asp-tRNA(Asn)/Glu-tRNA(Gln) amidotransferase A subunit family amidase
MLSRLTDCFDGGNSPIDDLCVVIPSITGLPAISLPYGNLESIKNMPVGIQLCGASCSEVFDFFSFRLVSY